MTLPQGEVELEALESRHLTVVVQEPREGWTRGRTIRIRVSSEAEGEESILAEAPLLGPQL